MIYNKKKQQLYHITGTEFLTGTCSSLHIMLLTPSSICLQATHNTKFENPYPIPSKNTLELEFGTNVWYFLPCNNHRNTSQIMIT